METKEIPKSCPKPKSAQRSWEEMVRSRLGRRPRSELEAIVSN